MAQANSVSDIERAEHLNYADGKGVKRVSIFNDGVQSNVATEETLQSIAGFQDSTTTIVTAGAVKTITETDGIKTCTTVIDSTDPLNKLITTTWS